MARALLSGPQEAWTGPLVPGFMSRAKVVRLDVPSSLRMLDTTDGLVGRVARAAEFDEHSVQEIQAAVREALQNAIVHGNRCDQGRCVKLQLELHPGELEIRVQDEGEGFAEDLTRPGGRGILLMKSLMDEVVFRRVPKGGMAVTMRRRRAGARSLESGGGAGSAMWWRDSADDGE